MGTYVGEMPLTRKAIEYAVTKHSGQKRKGSGLQYFTHPIEVYSIVKKYKESHNIDNICSASVLHDTIEDCGVTYMDLALEFNTMVASLVEEVTNDNEAIKIMGKEAYMNKKLEGLTSYALIIKLADMLSNITDQPDEKMCRRIRNHWEHLISGVRELTNTHHRLLEQIDLALTTLHNV
jgi:(p)ppGpp synthase/HD superfamily hydrolase